jgi:hypothetical protein
MSMAAATRRPPHPGDEAATLTNFGDDRSARDIRTRPKFDASVANELQRRSQMDRSKR